jgi:hypothetical protein
MLYELFFIYFLKVMKVIYLKIGKNTFLKLFIIYFDSNNRVPIPLSSFFRLHFDQMNWTWPIWSHYPIDPIIRDPIKRSLLYNFIWNSTTKTLNDWFLTFFSKKTYISEAKLITISELLVTITEFLILWVIWDLAILITLTEW